MNGQLGLSDLRPRLRPERISKELLGGWPALMVACGHCVKEMA